MWSRAEHAGDCLYRWCKEVTTARWNHPLILDVYPSGTCGGRNVNKPGAIPARVTWSNNRIVLAEVGLNR